MTTIHVSAEEAARDFETLVARVSADTVIAIDSENETVALLSAPPPRQLTLDERLALLRSKERVVLDDQFGRDLEAAIENHREPLDSSIWDE